MYKFTSVLFSFFVVCFSVITTIASEKNINTISTIDEFITTYQMTDKDGKNCELIFQDESWSWVTTQVLVFQDEVETLLRPTGEPSVFINPQTKEKLEVQKNKGTVTGLKLKRLNGSITNSVNSLLNKASIEKSIDATYEEISCKLK